MKQKDKNSAALVVPLSETKHTWFIVLFVLFFAGISAAEIQTTIGHHADGLESPDFAFTNVPSPSRNDAAATGKFTIVSGKGDANGGGLEKFHDGKVPTEADEPAENFFFEAGTAGGRIQVDLGRVCELKQINTYSWHPATRGPQVYTLYASEGTAHAFVAKPGKDTNLEKYGWNLIAKVDTRIRGGDAGGQYGVSISDSAGAIGNYRYLLFDISPTETDDDFGNTFYSEIDVVELNVPAQSVSPAATTPIAVRSADGYCEISVDTSKAPGLREWAQQKLIPALVEWYPQIVAMLPSEGYAAPKQFSIAVKPMDGVANTIGRKISVSSEWLDSQLNGEAVGALVHEVVHVVQQYGDGRQNGARPPGWLIEGIPDYIRFFKFEPQSHGADDIWLQHRRNLALNYDGMYRISANFLNYVVEHYDPDKHLIKKVNAACREGTYTDDLWKELTGKSLAELNEEWKIAVNKQLTAQTASGTHP